MKELTILMPCLNEAETIGHCIKRAQRLLALFNINGEILVSDNGSTDNSQTISKNMGARVVHCPVRGYGAALQYGIEHAEGKFILMGDSDDSYHFDEAMPMIEKLRGGADVCMGTRLKGTIMPDAMPALNRYIGNPILTALGKLFFKIHVTDFHCGMRAFRKDRIIQLYLVTTGMEWASEMIIKARMANLKIAEVPITLYKDGRSRPPHLKRWRDGWRHLRFMLLHSPTWLFMIPGLSMIALGLLGEAVLSQGIIWMGRIRFGVHSLLVMSFLLILGVQIAFTGLFAWLYSSLNGIIPYNRNIEKRIRQLTLEKLLAAALLMGIIGLIGFISTVWGWYQINFSNLDYQVTMQKLVPSLTLIAVSVQSIFNGFMLWILFLNIDASKSFRGSDRL